MTKEDPLFGKVYVSSCQIGGPSCLLLAFVEVSWNLELKHQKLDYIKKMIIYDITSNIFHDSFLFYLILNIHSKRHCKQNGIFSFWRYDSFHNLIGGGM